MLPGSWMDQTDPVSTQRLQGLTKSAPCDQSFSWQRSDLGSYHGGEMIRLFATSTDKISKRNIHYSGFANLVQERAEIVCAVRSVGTVTAPCLEQVQQLARRGVRKGAVEVAAVASTARSWPILPFSDPCSQPL